MRRSAIASLAAMTALCCVLAACASAIADAPGASEPQPQQTASSGGDATVGWVKGRVHTFQVDTKWWLASQSGAALCDTDVAAGWAPPVSPENHGVRCHVSVQPVAREVWPPVGPEGEARASPDTSRAHVHSGALGAKDGTTPNSWLFRAWVRHCTPLKARFEGEYVPMPRPSQEALDSDVDMQRLATPFYLTRGDDGVVRRLYFFGNETLVTRNFKRGVVTFLSFKHPPAEAHASVARALRSEEHGADSALGTTEPVKYHAVDQDENGM